MLDKLFNLVFAALSLSLNLMCVSIPSVESAASTHTSIGCIGDEARYTDTLGLLLREGSEVDALHLALDLELDLSGYISFATSDVGGQRTRLVDIVAVVVKKRFM
jgi:hypothetical protein